MKLLVVGSGGREHALIAKLKKSPLCSQIYCAPGNGGIASIAECIDIPPDDVDGLVNFARQEGIGLTVVGPEAPLVAGICDVFESEGLKVFGPSRDAAAFEGSKAMTKEFLTRHGIPTARYAIAHDYETALNLLDAFSFPLVLKADGLAGGKGVIIAASTDEAALALKEMMLDKVFGEAADTVVIEEFLSGMETSVLCFADGKSLIPMASVKDYKRVFDNDKGPNTGGMGTYSPNPQIDEKLSEKIEKTIITPILEGFLLDGVDYKGILYVGLMIVNGNPKVLEFNVRFGDPETQVLLMRLKSDLVKVMLNCTDGLLNPNDVIWTQKAAVCIVASSGGYPGTYETGAAIHGLENVRGATVFHAGTKMSANRFVTSGGRVLNVCAEGDDLSTARKTAYENIARISYEGMHYRKDIALLKGEEEII